MYFLTPSPASAGRVRVARHRRAPPVPAPDEARGDHGASHRDHRSDAGRHDVAPAIPLLLLAGPEVEDVALVRLVHGDDVLGDPADLRLPQRGRPRRVVVRGLGDAVFVVLRSLRMSHVAFLP